MKFTELDLDPKILKAVEDAGYETPTPIQEKAIPYALSGRDVLGIAQTGTGKTAAFTIPMIQILAKGRARARMPRSLILCPTRELAAQVSENFEVYGKYHKLSMALLIGGVSFKDQDKLIDRGVDVLIATPGRLLDHFERGKLMLTGVQVMVVDEADRMLDMGFIPDIERIFGLTPFTRQTLFFSATMPPEITRLTQTFLHNPERVEVAAQATTAENIEQVVVMHRPARRDVADSDKREVMRKVMEAEGDKLTNAIIFCNRKRDVDILFKSMKRHGYNAAALHGDLDQSVRTRTLNGFRDGEIKYLVASDVAARGLDIPNVSHIFNYDVPIHSEDYVHRIGRTGRAGRTGKSFTICLPSDEKYLAKIEELVKKDITRMESPLNGGGADAEEKPRRDGRDGATKEAAGDADEAPKRERRSRRRGGRRDEAAGAEPAKAEAPTKAKTEAPESAKAEPENDKPRETARPRETAEDEAPRERQSSRGRDDRNRRDDRGARNDRHGRDRGRGGGAPVVGMGDHMPAFLEREIDVKALLRGKGDDDGGDTGEDGRHEAA